MRRPATIAGRVAVAWVAFSVLTISAGSASGYVRKRSETGFPEYWSQSCIPITAYMRGSPGMPRDEVAKSVAASAHAWGPNSITCADGSRPYLEIVASLAGDDQGTLPAGNDGRNTVTFVENWGDRPFNALALTSTWHRPDGRIVDGDIEINADPLFGITWRNLDPGADFAAGNGQQIADLQNAVTHEMGHLLGLGHTCVHLGEDPDVDDQGQPVPECGSASDEIRQTVMYNGILSEGETSKRFLSLDEVRAVCEVYPQASDPRNCTLDLPNDGCGCAAGGARVPGPGAFLAAAATLAALTLRRDRRAAPARRAPRG